MRRLKGNNQNMKKPISVQLYSLRQQSEKDFVGVLKRVAKMGYKGVEPAGFYGLKPAELKKIVTDLGMVISSSHSPWISDVSKVQEAVDTAGVFGLDIVCTGYGPDDFKDIPTIKVTAEKTKKIVEKLKGTGLSLFLHNHYWEFERIDGKLKYDYFLDICPDVKLELDIYWAANFGAENPAKHLAAYKKRTILLHVKDGSLNRSDENMTAVGKGKNNIDEIIPAADPNVLRWLVVELDNCGTDMYEAVEESYKYLVKKGFAEGNK